MPWNKQFWRWQHSDARAVCRAPGECAHVTNTSKFKIRIAFPALDNFYFLFLILRHSGVTFSNCRSFWRNSALSASEVVFFKFICEF